MIDLKNINEALFDTLKQIAPADFRFIIVMWDKDQHAITSNEMDGNKIVHMLSCATKIAAASEPKKHTIDDGFVGSA